MKLYREVIKKERVVDEVRCDVCQQPIKEEQPQGYSLTWSCLVKVVSLYDGPGCETVQSDGKEYDICATCFREKLRPILEPQTPALPGAP